MNKIYGRSESIRNKVSTYCPGCLHGVANKIVAEVLDELGLGKNPYAYCRLVLERLDSFIGTLI